MVVSWLVTFSLVFANQSQCLRLWLPPTVPLRLVAPADRNGGEQSARELDVEMYSGRVNLRIVRFIKWTRYEYAISLGTPANWVASIEESPAKTSNVQHAKGWPSPLSNLLPSSRELLWHNKFFFHPIYTSFFCHPAWWAFQEEAVEVKKPMIAIFLLLIRLFFRRT